MRRILFAGCALIALQSVPAMALTDPIQMRAKDDARADERLRQVWWRPGVVIKLTGAVGQSLMVEMPKGMKLDKFMLSEQHIMKPAEEEFVDEGNQNQNTPKGKVAQEEGCSATVNLKVCVQRERFLFFLPFVALDPQSFPNLMIESKQKKTRKGTETEEIEHSIVFELSTVPEGQNPYYGVKVIVGDPPAPSAPVIPASPAVLAPSVPHETPMSAAPPTPSPHELLANRAALKPVVSIPPRPGMSKADKDRLKELERLPPVAPPPVNDKYILQGSRDMIGR